MRDKYRENNVEQNNNKRLLKKQREIYYAQVREENNGNIQQVDLSKMPYEKLQDFEKLRIMVIEKYPWYKNNLSNFRRKKGRK